MLRIAIQPKGRMNQECMNLLEQVGVKLSIRESNPVLVRSSNFPAEVLFLEKDSIPELVQSSVVDVAICGEYMAQQALVPKDCIVKRLGFDKSTLSLAIPRDTKYKGIEWFTGKTIATPYPELVQQFFKNKNIRTNVRLMREQVYMAPKIEVADAICDRVHSGTTLISEHLKEVEVIMQSEAVLIVSPAITPQKKMILDELIQRIEAVQYAVGKKFVSLNAPVAALDDIIEFMPSLRRPTITYYNDNEWATVSTVMDEKRLWDIIERLKYLGAEEIVICPIDKIIA